jgi:hypothetical protein
LTITNNGNVGIGSTSPSYPLTVSGTAYITGALVDSTGSAGTAGMILKSTATGFNWVATSTLGFGTGSGTVNSGTTGQIAYYSATGTAVSGNSSLYISSDGKVGINTTAPSEKLQIDNGNVIITGNTSLSGNDSYTKLLLHADDPDNLFVDDSSGNKTVTVATTTQTSTQYKFGGKSAYFDGVDGTTLTLADSDDLTVLNSDYTIDFCALYCFYNLFVILGDIMGIFQN